MIPFIGPIIAGIIELGKSIGGGIVKNRQIKAQGKVDITKARIAATVTKLEREADMDLEAMKGMQFSWKDEALLLWTLTMLTACFVPWTQPYVKEGFIFLRDSTPHWFGYCVTGMYVAVFGLRTFAGFSAMKK
jgi:hypothetical protein